MSCEASEEVTHTSSTRRTGSRPAFSKDKSINEKRHLGDELRGQRRGKRSRVSRRCVFVFVSSFALFFFRVCGFRPRLDWVSLPTSSGRPFQEPSGRFLSRRLSCSLCMTCEVQSRVRSRQSPEHFTPTSKLGSSVGTTRGASSRLVLLNTEV